MENKDNKSEKEDCCGSSGSCGCGGHRCCSGKAALVLVLLLIGGLIGFCIGRHHSYGCGFHYGMNCPIMGAPTTPGK
jgi:hypothetical protein